MKKFILASLFAMVSISVVAQDRHTHRLRYYINGNMKYPAMARLHVMVDSDTIAVLEATERFYVPEVEKPFHIGLQVDSQVIDAGPFDPDLLRRGSTINLYLLADFRYLLRSNNFHYELVKKDFFTSPRQKEIEKILVLVIESDALKRGKKRYKQSTTGRYKFFYRK